MRTWINVATLVKTKNLDGRFVARCAAGLPLLLREGLEVAFVPPQTDLARRAQVACVQDIDGASFEVRFLSIDDEGEARGLVGCSCLVRRDEVEVPEAGCDDVADVVGWAVLNADGSRIGEVVGIVENPAQALLEVAREADGGLSYIPFVEQLIVDLDESAEVIRVELPAGLLDL